MKTYQQRLLEPLWRECGHVRIVVNAEYPGVILPKDVEQAAPGVVILDTGFALERPPVIERDEEGFSSTMSFHAQAFRVRVLWGSVLAIHGKDFLAVEFHDQRVSGTLGGKETPGPNLKVVK